MFNCNLETVFVHMQASEKEITWVMRLAIFGVGALATIMGIKVKSIYGLWYLCADLVYVVLFPQLCSVVYLKGTNTYGSLSGYLVGLIVRLLGGEPLLGLPAAIHYPGYSNGEQMFPFKTFSMLTSFAVIVVVSYSTKFLFENGTFPKHYDIFRCVVNLPAVKQTAPSIVKKVAMSNSDISKPPAYEEVALHKETDRGPTNGHHEVDSTKVCVDPSELAHMIDRTNGVA